MIRVLICDDQALVRGGLRMMLDAQEDLEVVAEAGDGQQALDVAATVRPDVVLMDIRMPEVDGIEATRRILRTSGDAPRILVLTTSMKMSTCTRRFVPEPAGSCSSRRPRWSWSVRSGSCTRVRLCWHLR